MLYDKEELKCITSNLMEDLRAIGVPFVFTAYFEDEPTVERAGQIHEQEALYDVISEIILEQSIILHETKDKRIAELEKELGRYKHVN